MSNLDRDDAAIMSVLEKPIGDAYLRVVFVRGMRLQMLADLVQLGQVAYRSKFYT